MLFHNELSYSDISTSMHGSARPLLLVSIWKGMLDFKNSSLLRFADFMDSWDGFRRFISKSKASGGRYKTKALHVLFSLSNGGKVLS